MRANANTTAPTPRTGAPHECRSHPQHTRDGGKPALRAGFVTDNGCQILDVAELAIARPAELEAVINGIPGVVSCGIFALAGADVALISTQDGVRRLDKNSS